MSKKDANTILEEFKIAIEDRIRKVNDDIDIVRQYVQEYKQNNLDRSASNASMRLLMLAHRRGELQSVLNILKDIELGMDDKTNSQESLIEQLSEE